MNIHGPKAAAAQKAYGRKVLSAGFRAETHRQTVRLLTFIQNAENRRSGSTVRYKGSHLNRMASRRQVH